MRRTIALLAAAAALTAAADEIAPSALGPRTARYVYEARANVPEGARVVELWLPLPREEDQSILDLKLSGAPATVVTLSPSGDRLAHVRIENPTPGWLTLTQTATVMRREIRADARVSTAKLEDVDAAAYAAELGATPAVVINDEVRAIAKKQTAGRTTVVAKARALYDWVWGHMQYDKSVPGWGLGDVPYCLKVGKGNCTDFHTLFIALARASGIPARWNMGFPLAYGDGKGGGTETTPVQGYHCWAEFYAPGAGWVPVDISEARKHAELKDYFFGGLSGNRVLFTRARDAALPGDASGKRHNYLIYPVARADGQDLREVQWRFQYRDVDAAT
jgi:transglutaminase-like putative cysteine protease